MLHFQTRHLILIVPCGQSGVHIPHDAGRQGKDPELLSPGPEVCLLPCKPSSPHFHFPAVHLSGKGIHSPSSVLTSPLAFSLALHLVPHLHQPLLPLSQLLRVHKCGPAPLSVSAKVPIPALTSLSPWPRPSRGPSHHPHPFPLTLV